MALQNPTMFTSKFETFYGINQRHNETKDNVRHFQVTASNIHILYVFQNFERTCAALRRKFLRRTQ